MSGKTAKKMRQVAKRAAEHRDHVIFPELKSWINDQKFFTRVLIALKIVIGRF